MKITLLNESTRWQVDGVDLTSSELQENSTKHMEIVKAYIEEFMPEGIEEKTTYFREIRKVSKGECPHCDGSGCVENDYEGQEDCFHCEGEGEIFQYANYDWDKMKDLRKLLDKHWFKGITHYVDVDENGEWYAEIFAIFDCFCPCSDLSIARITQ